MLRAFRLFLVLAMGFMVCPSLALAAAWSEPFSPVMQYDVPVGGAKALTVADIKKAFLVAAYQIGYVVRKNTDDSVQLHLDTRVHSLDISVKFTATSYEITYVNSAELGYEPGPPPVIHPKYKIWMANLVKHANAEIMRS